MNEFKLKAAQKELENFLQENPEALNFQNELEACFGNFDNDPFYNMQIISHYLRWNVEKLNRIKDSL